MENKRYGLFTAITMITGIVIGSGIFFKSDDVLGYTNGNMFLGVIVFCVAAFSIIFGCLAVSQLAGLTDRQGGMVAYASEFINDKVACAFGWFQMTLYYPTLVAVVGWVAGMYIAQLFGLEGNNFVWALIGAGCVIVIFAFNILSARFGGIFQNASMIIKLIPLMGIAVAGIVYGNPVPIMAQDVKTLGEATASAGFLAAFAPIAFSFDGWIVATSIGHEIKNSKRNLPLALIIAPLVILTVYVGYFVGISSLVGVETVLAQGNDSVYRAANMLLGPMGAKLILVFVIVSVLGTVNGLVLGFIRLPQSLAIHEMIPKSDVIKKTNEKFSNMPVNSAMVAFVIALFWIVMNYITQEGNMRGDVSEIAVTVSYLNYIALYIAVIRLTKAGKLKNKIMGYFVPVMAIIGALIIVLGSLTHPLFIYYLLICYGVMTIGFCYKKTVKK